MTDAKKIKDLEWELAEVNARLDRHSLILEQLEKSIETSRGEAGNAYDRANQAHDRIDEIE